ncbi:AAA family ATPase [Neomoorella thermoacetica]|uniref:AAA family ATPase n=1 Tax=Neomoorella thermoacetica TaxID=1525 RepID=UPI0008FB3389|nr:AAA family ATPase [Moorella thermoacetica]APC08993.1 chromosome partition protein Smc [Moorella thermoacetica]
MFLHSLTVAGLRRFRNPVALTGFDPGINIIYGPNECGKSTLIWGLILAFLNRHNVSGEEIARFRPWGTALNPIIKVEFTAGGKRYRLDKGFLDEARCTLSEWTGGGYQDLARGKAADEMVFQMMQAQMAGRGLTKSSQWGLAHLLWMPQDRERLTAPALTGNVQDYFRESLGSTIFTPADDRLLAVIDRKYSEIYTQKRGVLQARSPVHQARQRLEEIKEQLATLRQALEQVNQVVAELETQQARHEALQRELAGLRAREKGLKEQVEAIKTLQAGCRQAEAELKTATTIWEKLKTEWRRVNELEESINLANAEMNQEKDSLASLGNAWQEAGQKLGAAEERLATLENELGRARKALQQSYDRQQARERLVRVGELSRRLKKARQVTARIAALEGELARQPLPGPEEVKTVTETWNRINSLEAEARAMGLSINFRAYRDLELSVTTAAGREKRRVGPDQPLLLAATDRLALEIPGAGLLEVRSGSRDLHKLLQEIAGLRQDLEHTLAAFGVASVDELQERYNWSVRQRTELKALGDNLGQVLGPGNTLEAMEKQVLTEQTALAEQCAALGITGEELLALPGPDIAPLKVRLQNLQEEEEKQKQVVTQLRQQFQDLERRLAEGQKKLETLQARIRAAREERDRRLEAWGGSAAKLQAELVAAETARSNKTLTLEELKRRLPANAAEIEQEANRVEKKREELEREILAVRDKLTSLKTQLDLSSGQGLYSRLAGLEEEYELAGAEYQHAARYARAIWLLHLIMHNRRDQMLNSLTGPVRQEVSDLFQQITGRRERSVELNADLSLAGLKVGVADPQPLDVFSVGTQEQLMVAIRLALGRFLGAGERQLVVLDDALVNTDAGRRSRILDLLAAAAEKLQIIILTCHPENYSGLKGRLFNVEELG